MQGPYPQGSCNMAIFGKVADLPHNLAHGTLLLLSADTDA